MSQVYIVAEIGINHQGDVRIANQLMKTAAKAGVNAVKFQKRDVSKASTRMRWSNTFQREMPNDEHRRLLEFSKYQLESLQLRAKELGVDWSASVFDEPSLQLMRRLDPDYWKVPSVVTATNPDLALEVARSDGMCYLSLGMTDQNRVDYLVDRITKESIQDVTLMHCVGEYPCKPERVNIDTIPMLQLRYGLPVGYSSHDEGIAASIAAATLGATSIENHFTLDKKMPGSDHSSSLDPSELQLLVKSIRDLEKMRGDGKKRVTDDEQRTLDRLRG